MACWRKWHEFLRGTTECSGFWEVFPCVFSDYVARHQLSCEMPNEWCCKLPHFFVKVDQEHRASRCFGRIACEGSIQSPRAGRGGHPGTTAWPGRDRPGADHSGSGRWNLGVSVTPGAESAVPRRRVCRVRRVESTITVLVMKGRGGGGSRCPISGEAVIQQSAI
jgi:hypothetical protein